MDGKKGLNQVDDVKEIESITLEYKIDSINSELKQRIGHRQREVNTLAEERAMLCQLIDWSMIGESSHHLIDSLIEKYPRFYEIKTLNEMNEEFDLINKQILIHNLEILQIREQMKEIESLDIQKENLNSITIPCGTIGHIHLINGPLDQNQTYDCYWKCAIPRDHETQMKRRRITMEINDHEIKKKYIDQTEDQII